MKTVILYLFQVIIKNLILIENDISSSDYHILYEVPNPIDIHGVIPHKITYSCLEIESLKLVLLLIVFHDQHKSLAAINLEMSLL